MDYLVIIEKTNTGYSAYVPDLPGCITVGDTKEEVRTHIKEAVQFHLEGMREDGIEIPPPSTEAVTVAA
ncbi:type II toxin-antitoxin system HicB family antitoxin [Tunicatimonas pelagia]|uniref:type II toxin-antitoxin system HicB family antitoxin n=1 Tax=Tunicatimonas pelagia TaxID=931531 RepID=UPI002665193A|nr:type II toxin-antitoxin system HicB family antitoxin [Tunicatimonas pelagia]WKN43871.1 type II toxin-antitoxin system HicB family antitoxin [Tunicatimonas pelagia]